jgi:hypothetical protein
MIIMDPLIMKLLIQSEPDPSYPYKVRYTNNYESCRFTSTHNCKDHSGDNN